MIKGYLDRIEDNNKAVILVEELNKEYVVPVTELPDGSAPKTWFNLVIIQDQITSIEKDAEKTNSEYEKMMDLLAKLRSKNKMT